MGRFSTTVHIKNNSDREGFVGSFCEVMKKRGFVPCSEDEAALSYLLTFGEGWVTLANEDYSNDPRKAYDDSREMAAALKSSAFSVEVVDSDFAVLKLSDPNGGEDEVVVGDGSGYGIEEPTRGTQELWNPLLAEGRTWEQFSVTAAKNEVFVEDTLAELAVVLGIEPYYIDADFDEVLEKSDENKNITAFYFKKADEKKKPMTLNAAFIKVFGEGLEPLGFKRLKNIKNKYPYYVRVVNGDILHAVSYRQTTSPKIGYKEFEVYCGVMTLYRREISFPGEPQGILKRTFDLYRKAVKCGKIDPSVKEPQINYMCNATDSDEMLRKIERVFNETMGILLNYIDKITNLDACVEYFKIHEGMKLYPFDEFITLRYTSWSEALLLVKTRDMDDSLKRIKKEYKDYDFSCFGTRYKQEDIEKFLKKENEEREQQYEYRLEMINNPELNKRVMDELERCKANNIELLKSYGISFDEDDNIAAPNFKQAAAKAKPMSLNAAFKKVFGEALEPLGYKLIKSKYPYYVRVVTDEIIHVISYYNDKKCYDPDRDYIQIQGGVATVYRRKIDLTHNPRRENWLTSNCGIYIYRLEHNLEKLDDELKNELYSHSSSPDESLKEMEYQLALTKRFILPALNKAVTIDSCIEHNFEIRMNLSLYDDGCFGATWGNSYYSEGMLYFKTNKEVFENGMKNAISELALQKKAYFEKVHNDPELYNEVQAELERRKKENTETLRSYGVEI